MSRRKTPLRPHRILDDTVAEVEASISPRAWRKFYWQDHHILRNVWLNFDQVDDGVYRSNQPDVRRYRALQEFGIKSILNLRGEKPQPFYEVIEKSCTALGLNLYTVNDLRAHRAPLPERMIEVLDILNTVERPILMHCKSGADRTGLASMIYLMDRYGLSVEDTREQLSAKYVHFRWSKTGILDLMMDEYEKVEHRIGIRDWIETEYDLEALTKKWGRPPRRGE